MEMMGRDFVVLMALGLLVKGAHANGKGIVGGFFRGLVGEGRSTCFVPVSIREVEMRFQGGFPAGWTRLLESFRVH